MGKKVLQIKQTLIDNITPVCYDYRVKQRWEAFESLKQ